MKKRNLQRIFAAFMASALAVSTVACGGDEKKDDTTTPAPTSTETTTPDTNNTTTPDDNNTTVEPTAEPEPEFIIDPTTGAKMDLGGMEIIVRDWWSGDPGEPTNDFEEARQEWLDYIQETYNFTIKAQAISDWGSAPSDFVDYATTGDDGANYVFVLRNDPAIVSGMSQGLFYDLSTIPWLDFSKEKFTRNKNHELYSKGSAIYGMAAGYSEARTGIFFNKQVLKDAGVDPESLYDMQANGTWTWDALEEICAKVQRDVDSDGIDDFYGLTINESVMTSAAVWSNNGSFIGKNADGFYYNLEAPETVEALNWCVDMYTKYDNHDPEGAQWDYYKEEFLSGKVAFMPDDAYCGTPGNFLMDAEFEIGFVSFPVGPQGSTFVNCWSNNIVAIPACYSKDKAEKIAFAWNLYTDMPAGYENYKDLSNYRSGILDSRAIDETVASLMESEHGMVEFHSLIPSLAIGPDFEWSVGPNADITALTEAIRDTWKGYVDAANN